MKSWIHNWKKNNWKTAAGQPVKNKEDLVKLDAIMKEFAKVEYVSLGYTFIFLFVIQCFRRKYNKLHFLHAVFKYFHLLDYPQVNYLLCSSEIISFNVSAINYDFSLSLFVVFSAFLK